VPCWIGPLRVTERIGQAYHLALPEQYYRLHDVVPIQLIEPYKARDDGDLMPMPALEDPQDEWEVEDIKDSARIGSKRYYLVKWTVRPKARSIARYRGRLASRTEPSAAPTAADTTMIWTDQSTCEIALLEAVFAEALKVLLC